VAVRSHLHQQPRHRRTASRDACPALGAGSAGDRRLSAWLHCHGRRSRHLRLDRPAHADRLPVRAGARPARDRHALRPLRTPAATPDRAVDQHAGRDRLRARPGGRAADPAPVRPGVHWRGRGRHLARDRAGPQRGASHGARVQPAGRDRLLRAGRRPASRGNVDAGGRLAGSAWHGRAYYRGDGGDRLARRAGITSGRTPRRRRDRVDIR
ncbi:MAG: Multidrug resistance transporter, Bcr/CflA family, partial [uncultured Thermomicrobiales bacterium]